MEFLIAILVLVTLVNTMQWVHARHRRRAAQARLEIARTVTRLEEKLLSGEVAAGNVCHDRIFKRMLEIQYAERLGVKWKWWQKLTPEQEQERRFLHTEMAAGTELGNILRQYAMAVMSSFRNQRPYVALVFLGWLSFSVGGLLAALGGVWALASAGLFGLKLLGGLKRLVEPLFAKATIAWNEHNAFVQEVYLAAYLRTR